jgi:hypothetical protein
MDRSSALRTVAAVAGLLLVLATTPVALGKEGVSVELAAPIPRDAQPGDVVAVVFRLTAIDDQGDHPLRGSPVFIRLFGPTGARTEASGVEDRTPGTYRAMIAIPSGGAARAEFGIHGSATDASGRATSSDIVWAYDGVLVAAAPPAAAGPGTFHAPAGPGTPAAQVRQDADDPPVAAAPDGRLGGLVAVGLAVLGLVLWAVRRRRRWATSAI